MVDENKGRVSGDAQAMMMFEANKKSVGVSYLLWFFLGVFGGHRFYLKRTGSAIAILLLWIIGWISTAVVVGFALLAGVVVWVIVDAFLIPSWVRQHNNLLAAQLGAGSLVINP